MVMVVEGRGCAEKLISKDVLAFAGMLIVEFLVVGGNTLYKSASSAQAINTYVFTFYVFLIGFFFLLPCLFIVYRRTGLPPIQFFIVWKIFILSVLTYSSQLFGYTGLKYGSPTLSSIMSNLSPAFTFVLAFLFKMEKIDLFSNTSQAKIIGTIVSISGATIATLYNGPSLLTASRSINWIIGGILLASKYFILSFSLVAQAKIMLVYSVDLVVVFAFTLSGLIIAGLAALIMVRDFEAWKLRPNVVLGTIIFMGFSTGFFNVMVQIWVLRVKGPVYAAMFKPLAIVIAVAMGVLFLGDSLYLGSVVGGIVITVGFYGVVWGKANERVAPSVETTAPLLEPHDDPEEGS